MLHAVLRFWGDVSYGQLRRYAGYVADYRPCCKYSPAAVSVLDMLLTIAYGNVDDCQVQQDKQTYLKTPSTPCTPKSGAFRWSDVYEASQGLMKWQLMMKLWEKSLGSQTTARDRQLIRGHGSFL